MSQPPVPEFIYLIINKQSNLIWGLSQLEKNLVVGTPMTGDIEKWRFVQTGPYWTIKNVTNNQFANLQPGKPIAPGVQVATATPRNWELRFDKIWGGWRIINPETKLNAAIPSTTFPPVPEPPVILEVELPEDNQIWTLEPAII